MATEPRRIFSPQLDAGGWFSDQDDIRAWFDSSLATTETGGGGAASITGAGQIASAEAHGAPTIAPTVAAAGIASTETAGQPTIAATVAAAGVASAEALGQPVVSTGVAAQNVVDAGGIASAQAIGSPTLAAGISTAALATAEAIGQPALAPTVGPVAITSAEQLGSPVVSAGVAVTGIPEATAFGQPTVGTAAEIFVASILSGEAWGLPDITAETAAPTTPEPEILPAGDDDFYQEIVRERRARRARTIRQNNALILALTELAVEGVIECH